MNNLTTLSEWQLLHEHYSQMNNQNLKHWFENDSLRTQRFSLNLHELTLDYSRQLITEHTLSLLLQLAETSKLRDSITKLFAGKAINITEKRAVLHTALRDQDHKPLWLNNENIAQLIIVVQEQMAQFVRDIHAGSWRGSTGRPIKHIINIGIGGSYFGPKMTIDVLNHYSVTDLCFHFISTVDPEHLQNVLLNIDPETSLFIISSKSFTTLETMTNTHAVIKWMQKQLGKEILSHHFIAITANEKKAQRLGITHIFPLWEWVGGRYSVWSTIGLPLMLLIGVEQFQQFLEGAFIVDEHFKQAEFLKNMPVILGLLGIWNINFLGTSAHAIVPYAFYMRHLIPYLQQLDMESNGKNRNLRGDTLNYDTSPIIFGQEGCEGQHAYHQLLHQSNKIIPVDFIIPKETRAELFAEQQDMMIASALSQADALAYGKTYDTAYQQLQSAAPPDAALLAKHKTITGNKPSNLLWLQKISPKTLGMLLALYEHKITVQGIIWQINSFDQWGVELGKELLPNILQKLKNKE